MSIYLGHDGTITVPLQYHNSTIATQQQHNSSTNNNTILVPLVPAAPLASFRPTSTRAIGPQSILIGYEQHADKQLSTAQPTIDKRLSAATPSWSNAPVKHCKQPLAANPWRTSSTFLGLMLAPYAKFHVPSPPAPNPKRHSCIGTRSVRFSRTLRWLLHHRRGHRRSFSVP